jgi:uncharacterized membrane protein
MPPEDANPTELKVPEETKTLEAIRSVAPELLQKLPPEKVNQVVRVVQSVSYNGPIPSPSTLAEFDSVLPGLAQTLVEMAVKEQDHRLSCERLIVETQTSAIKLGQKLGFTFGMVSIVAGIIAALTGHDWVAGTIFTTVVIGGVTVFVLGKPSQSKTEKIEPTPPRKPEPLKKPRLPRTGGR